MKIRLSIQTLSVATISMCLAVALCQCSGYGKYFLEKKTTDNLNTALAGSLVTYTISGTVSGLSGTLVLQNNGADDLAITADGSFTFSTTIADDEVYDVTVKTNPASQVCLVKDNQGVVAGANVSNIQVQCASDTNWVQDAYLKASNSGGR